MSSKVSFPSYNIALGFWGLYSAFSKQGRATFGLIAFSLFAMVLDIIFCSLSGMSINISMILIVAENYIFIFGRTYKSITVLFHLKQIYTGLPQTTTDTFCLTMFVLCLFLKVTCFIRCSDSNYL